MEPKLPFARCDQCTLNDCPLVPPSGNTNASVVVVGEAPGAVEVEKGKPFVGPSGQMLDYAIAQAGVDPINVYRTNVVSCRPPSNREPTPEEIVCCSERLCKEIESTSGVLIGLGRIAAQTLGIEGLGRGEVSIGTKWNGKVMHTFHPAYVLRKPSDAPIFINDIKKAVAGPRYVNPKWLDPDVIVIDSVDMLREWLAKCPDGAWLSFDIETDQTRWFVSYDGTPADPILMLQMAWEETFGIVLDDVMLYDVPETRIILREFFKRVKTVGHNAKFDAIFLSSHIGVHPHLDFDTMLAHYILDENSAHGLKELVTEIYGVPDYEKELISQYLKSKNDRYSKVPFDQLAKYGVRDVIWVLVLRKEFEAALRKSGQYEWPFENILMRASNTFVNVELRGVKVDVPYLIAVQKFLEGKMTESHAAACASVGRTVESLNLESPQQVAEVIYDQLKFPLNKSKKTKPRSTAHDVTEKLKGKHPFINHLQEYRRMAKMKSSYADNLLEGADINGRVHASFLLHGTEVGRLSARNPALQTIPRAEKEADDKGMYGAMIRAAFIAEPGKLLLVADYSQAELRVAAVLAEEAFLLDVYENDRDLHTEVAIAMYGPNYTKEQRVACKMFNFSYLYGGSEYSFALDAGLNIAVARAFVKKYNEVMPKLAEFRREQFKKLSNQGFVESPFGRRRHIEIITKANEDDARKACVHSPVAGTASDLTLLSACDMDDAGYAVVLSVHDSVLIEIDIPDKEIMEQRAADIMVSTGDKWLPQVKWKADSKARLRWSDPPAQFLQSL